MHRLARLVIALVLAVALPWHAAAVATMIDCQPPGGHEHHVTAAADEGAGHAAHHAQGHDAHGHPDLAAKAKCHASASCCAAAALPSPATAFDGAGFSQRFTPPAPAGVAAFLTSGLERPPRTIFA
jgi:hypothetical protein